MNDSNTHEMAMTISGKERVIFARGRDRDYTAEEYNRLCDEHTAAEARGDEAEVDRLVRILPMNPDVLKAFKDTYGKDFILESGFDLTQANIAFGEGWLDE